MSEFYLLEISVAPGGARKHDIHVATKLEHVHSILQTDLIKDAALAIWYGEEIWLHRCRFINESNSYAQVVETVNLHPRITFYVGDFAPMKFDQDNKIIGYYKSASFSEETKCIDNPDPIDFSSKNIQEVYRYLYYDTYEKFRIMRARAIRGSNMEAYPPNVGVQIKLDDLPRIEEPLRRIKSEFNIKIGQQLRTLNYGLNSFE